MPYSKEQLRADLQNLQIKRSDTLLIHSSMKSIGEVDGGADSVLDMLMEYFADDGLLVFPTLSYRDVNAESPRFDVRNTPACTGILPELFRQRSGVVRSLHPTHSVAAFGRDAASFTANHENASTPAPVGSPWWKLLQRRGKIMFIGTTINCNTFLHGVEEWLPVPGMLTEDSENLVVFDYDGNRIEVPSRRHAGSHSHFYAVLKDEFTECGALSEGTLGDAHVFILQAKAAGELVYEILKKTPLFFTEEFQKSR